jgi:hypothetical protein
MIVKEEVKERIKERYGKIALTGNFNSCCTPLEWNDNNTSNSIVWSII